MMKNYYTVHHHIKKFPFSVSASATQLNFVPFHSSKEFFFIICFREVISFVSSLPLTHSFIRLLPLHTYIWSNVNHREDDNNKADEMKKIINRKHTELINDFLHHHTIYCPRPVCHQHHQLVSKRMRRKKSNFVSLTLPQTLSKKKRSFVCLHVRSLAICSPMFTSEAMTTTTTTKDEIVLREMFSSFYLRVFFSNA